MTNSPSTAELVEAVRGFIETVAAPALSGHAAFHARVAANVLAIVARELADGPAAAEAETARLEALLGLEGSRDALNRALCTALREGRITLATPGLREHLWATAIAKVAIDQPGYSGLKQALSRQAG